MALEQQQQSVETERRYSPEEAGEILKIAANLQDDSFSMEHLRAIAQEAGISEEHLQQAVKLYEQQQKELPQQRARVALKRQTVAAIVAGVVLFFLLAAAITFLPNAPALSAHTGSPQTVSASPVSGELLASSDSCEVYRAEQIWEDNHRYELVRIVNLKTGKSFVVGHRFRKVVSASISLTGKHVALYDEGTGEVWVVETDGEGLHCVARAGQAYGEGVVDRSGSPIAGWSTYKGNDSLKVRLVGGDTAYVFTESPQ
jgi:DNA-binding transcriptional MerR regulator